MPHALSAGKNSIPERTMIFELWGNIGLRKGDFKLWSQIGREYSPNWESLVTELKREDLALFDIRKDVAEKHDLRTQLPEVYSALKSELIDHFANINSEYPGIESSTDSSNVSPKPKDTASSPRPNPRSTDQFFNRRDRNSDGVITLEEFIGNPKGRNVAALTQQFHKIDSDGDAKLQRKELQK